MRCKLYSTENPRSFEKYPTPPFKNDGMGLLETDRLFRLYRNPTKSCPQISQAERKMWQHSQFVSVWCWFQDSDRWPNSIPCPRRPPLNLCFSRFLCFADLLHTFRNLTTPVFLLKPSLHVRSKIYSWEDTGTREPGLARGLARFLGESWWPKNWGAIRGKKLHRNREIVVVWTVGVVGV